MPTSSPNRPHRSAGFSVAELLVVIAILGILAGILVVAFGNVGGSSERRQTVALLERLKNAMAEIENNPAANHKFYSLQLPSLYFPSNDGNPNSSNRKTWIGVPASALESHVATGRVLDMIRSNPAAKKIMDDVPAERRAKIKFSGFPTELTGVLPAGSDYEPEVLLDAWGNPILFVFDNLQRPTGANTSLPLVLTSGANNIPTGGLFNLYSESTKLYWQPTAALSPAPTYFNNSSSSPNTTMPNPPQAYQSRVSMTDYQAYRNATTSTVELTYRSPDQRPFWVSAGPDGKYETHDDNVYSFGN